MKKLLVATTIIFCLTITQTSWADNSRSQQTINNVVLHNIDTTGGTALTAVLNDLFNTTVLNTLKYMYYSVTPAVQGFDQQGTALIEGLKYPPIQELLAVIVKMVDCQPRDDEIIVAS